MQYWRPAIVTLMALFSSGYLYCSDAAPLGHQPDASIKENTMRVKMTIHQQIFDVELYDNPAVTAWLKQLPLTLHMAELNGNEKFIDLADPLPINPQAPGLIQQGDLMLYGSKTLVLFYATFPTSYRYTPLGKVIAPQMLAQSLGTQAATVTFSIP
ncbi:cyclophilin-like fold protein [Dickeya lacustris]|uniref:Cyclophilin-like fold protein n=1 Tax=Dickeya lacustris TaxID=2259638 RepID=A0ABY8GBF3_9GAMM|nr:cyclophilin-like fold protein [Dickeya lacustris]WFN57346.1 cyclophilin-like fold protein [Dickeya lacustris]